MPCRQQLDMLFTRVLEDPYLLAEILEHLQTDFRSLLWVIQVNQTWFDEGITVLWRSPPLGALDEIAIERRQMYTGKVQCVSLQITHTSTSMSALSATFSFNA